MSSDQTRRARGPAVHRRRVGRLPRTARRSRIAIRSPARSSRACRRVAREDARRAIEAAAAAFPAWSQAPPGRAAADLPEGGRHPRGAACDEVVSLLARETGATLRLRHVPDGLRARACSARRRRSPTRRSAQIIPSDIPATFAMGLRKPVGVVGAIAPWNAALILSARSIAAPLALGNTVVLKPSELSPVVGGLLWGEIFAEAGLPAGVLEHRHARARRGGADRRRARREPRRAPHQLHRLDRDRAAARRGGRPAT